MRVLVTGGAGFIGSHVVDALVARGDEVLTVDALLPGAHAHGLPDYLNPGAEFVHGDLREEDVAAAAARSVDAVCHQASMVGLGSDVRDVAEYVAHNDMATAVLLRALARESFAGRIVLASSMVVYGEGRYLCREHGVVRPGPRAITDLNARRFEPRCPVCADALTPEAVPEDAPTDPRNVYAATKLHQEHLCTAFARECEGVTVTALRYHNVYGARMPRDTPYAGVASILRSAVAAGRPPEVFEDGDQLRDFVDVRDVARANVLALTRDEALPGPVNVATGTPRSVGDMARALVAAAGPQAPAPRVTGAYRRGDVRHVFAATGHARDALGFTAQITLEAGMRDFATAKLRDPPSADAATV